MKKLLIVDDSPDLLYAMQKLLTFYDFTIKAAKDSKTLMKEVDEFKPEIILIDVMLGGDDGRDICRAVRANQAYNQITLILFSASPKHLVNYQDCGADGAIEKPFGINDLINQIKFAVLSLKALLIKANSFIITT